MSSTPLPDTGAPSGHGYASATAVTAGQSLTLHLSLSDAAAARDAVLEVVRLGDATAPVRTWTQRLHAPPPPPPRPWEGLDWPVSCQLDIPTDWPSGLYSVRGPGEPDWLCFVVRAAAPQARVLAAVDFITPQAYCNSGGKSLYDYNSGGEGAICVGFDRPGALPYPEFRLASWLAAEGLAADWCCTLDLAADPTLLNNHDLLIVGGHFEYWTGPMRAQLERFVHRGGRLIVLSGNTGYRRVRWDAAQRRLHYAHRPDRDPCADNSDLAITFSEPPLSQPVNHLLGGGWWCGALGRRRDARAPSAYTCVLPDHWVFDGVWPSDHDGPRRTAPFMHYETDAVHAVLQPQGHALPTGCDGAPRHTLVLAQADLRHWDRPGWATMSLTSVGLGRVFHAGTTDWLAALDRGDAQLSRITRNVLERFTADVQAPRSPAHLCGEPLGLLPTRGRLATGHRRLYCYDADGTLWQRDALPTVLPWQPAGRIPAYTQGLCHDGQRWWALDRQGRLWACDEVDPGRIAAWRALDGPDGPQAAALCALPQCLYAAAADGTLWCRSTCTASPADWRKMAMTGLTAPVQAMALRDHHLLLCAEAAAGTAALWRHDVGFIEDSVAWVPLHVWPGTVWSGLVHVDGLFYAAEAGGRLLWCPGAALLGRRSGGEGTMR